MWHYKVLYCKKNIHEHYAQAQYYLQLKTLITYNQLNISYLFLSTT